jgi:hypothetical protein
MDSAISSTEFTRILAPSKYKIFSKRKLYFNKQGLFLEQVMSSKHPAALQLISAYGGNRPWCCCHPAMLPGLGLMAGMRGRT